MDNIKVRFYTEDSDQRWPGVLGQPQNCASLSKRSSKGEAGFRRGR